MDHLKGNDMSNSKECIKANPTLQRIPIIAVTSYALSGEDALARAAGCDCGKALQSPSPATKIRTFLP